MRAITKGREPNSLIAHRKTSDSNYENYKKKDDLRRALVVEQRGLCCYCMGRIRPELDSMKIEHWKCQSDNKDEQLTYQNLLGACLGGDGQSAEKQHCDTKKGKSDLTFNPANPNHRIETRIRYELDGSIHSDDTDFDGEINDVLNLNLPLLKNNRKGALDGVLKWWRREKARRHNRVPSDCLIQKRDKYIGGDGELTPYCQVAVWLLDQKLKRRAA